VLTVEDSLQLAAGSFNPVDRDEKGRLSRLSIKKGLAEESTNPLKRSWRPQSRLWRDACRDLEPTASQKKKGLAK
jgi:hypothetical protein